MKEFWANLLTVKSIITILTTLIFCVLLVAYIFIPTLAIPQEFMMIYTTIIAFYFGTQSNKKSEPKEEIKIKNEQIQ